MPRRKSYDDRKKFRNSISFFLYVFIVLFSLSCCGVFSVVNPKAVSNVFTNRFYAESVKQDVVEYAQSKCLEASIPNDAINKAVSFDCIHQLLEAYSFSQLEVSDQYNDNAFGSLLNDYKQELNKRTQAMIDEQKIEVDSKASLDSFCKDIVDYTKEKVEFKYMSQLKSIVKYARLLSCFVMGISAIGVFVLGLILTKKGGKNYRITRSFSYSFLAAAILNLMLVFSGVMVKLTKDLVIYPMYLAKSFMDYYNSALLSVTYASAILLLISIVLMSLTWKFKRQERD